MKNRYIIPDLIGFGFSEKVRMINEHSLEAHSKWMAKFFSSY